MEVHIFMNKKGRKQKKYFEHFKNTNDFIQKLNDYIYYYNTERTQRRLHLLTPISYHKKYYEAA